MATAEPRSAAIRAAGSLFATGVTVVTTHRAGVAVGLTVNSFATISLDPPLVSWSLRCASRLAEAFLEADRFCVSVLAAHQRDVALAFAGRGDADPARFLAASHDGPPAVAGALASFACRTRAIHDGGDHVIVLGHVERAETAGTGAPLVFYASRFFDGPGAETPPVG